MGGRRRWTELNSCVSGSDGARIVAVLCSRRPRLPARRSVVNGERRPGSGGRSAPPGPIGRRSETAAAAGEPDHTRGERPVVNALSDWRPIHVIYDVIRPPAAAAAAVAAATTRISVASHFLPDRSLAAGSASAETILAILNFVSGGGGAGGIGRRRCRRPSSVSPWYCTVRTLQTDS